MLTIDGSQGEGGGQILRTSLALSLISRRPFTIEKIRAGREKPGLLRQHLTAVEAATQIGAARVEGAALRSSRLVFHPGEITPGDYRFAVGTAGSATLVLQTILPPLLMAGGPSRLTLEGGTHNPFAPPFDFLQRVFLPLLNRMGGQVTVKLDTPGFYPAGGGRFCVEITPGMLQPLDLSERGAIRKRTARALISNLPRSIAERELATIEKKLGCDEYQVEEVTGSRGPGNIVFIEIESEHVTEIFTGFGERGTLAETVAENAVEAARTYLAAGVPVGEYLADQLLIPMALALDTPRPPAADRPQSAAEGRSGESRVAGGGSFVTLAPARHARTNAEVIGLFLDVAVGFERLSPQTWRVDVRHREGDGAR